VYALVHSPGPRLAGAFIRNVRALPTSPTSGGDNTSSTVTLQGKTLDPFRRTGAATFALDRSGAFGSSEQQASGGVTVAGWADTPASWASAAIGNGAWYYRIRSSGVTVGAGPPIPDGRWAGPVAFTQSGGAGLPRSLYVYVNKSMYARAPGVGSNARSLYAYVNKAVQAHPVIARSLYLYLARIIQALVGGRSRALFLYESKVDGEVFPYLSHIAPAEQYQGGQVSLYGDGFGQFLECRGSATVSVSSTFAGTAAENVRDGTGAVWRSNSDGNASWIRLTWPSAKRIVAVALEDTRTIESWGAPRFRFDDNSTQDGAGAPPMPEDTAVSTTTPVGLWRQVYWLATPKTTTWVQIESPSGSYSVRGFAEVWTVEEIVPADQAETARAWLNLDLISEQAMGIVTWGNRSLHLYPANDTAALEPAAVVTIPSGAVSGLVTVQEET
jgi:hypothetical protein